MSYIILIERWSPVHVHWRVSVLDENRHIFRRIEQPFARKERAVEAACQLMAQFQESVEGQHYHLTQEDAKEDRRAPLVDYVDLVRRIVASTEGKTWIGEARQGQELARSTDWHVAEAVGGQKAGQEIVTKRSSDDGYAG